MSLEDAAPAAEPERLAACASAVDRYLGTEFDALLRSARKSLILSAHDALDEDEEDRLIATVDEVEVLVPLAARAFRSAVLIQLSAHGEGEGAAAAAPADEASGLTLVDSGKVDDWLRMREIIERRSEETRALEQGLQQRLALAAGLPANADSSPLSVPGLCALFHESVRHRKAGHEARAAVYDAFEATVVARLDTLIEELYLILDSAELPAPGAASGSADAAATPSPDSRPADADSASAPAMSAAPAQDAAGLAGPSVQPGHLLGAIAAVERQMDEVTTGRGLEGLAELESRLTAALTPPDAPLGEPQRQAVAAIAGLVQQAFSHPGIDPAVRARLWKLAPPLALLTLQDDDQLELALQSTRYDPVTGLLDRTAFRVRLEASLVNADARQRFALCIVGVDGFEDISRRVGQQVAGRLLRVLAEMVRRRAGEGAQLARLRGAEFAVLLPAHHRDSGWRFANSYLASVNRAHFAAAGRELKLSVSIGVVESDHALASAIELMQAADAAHRAAREDGGDCARVHIPEGFG